MFSKDIRMRDPFVLVDGGKYYLYGTTDKNVWRGPGEGFDFYVSSDLVEWEGPYPAFRPGRDFWADQNFWAPEVHKYEGKYYMFASFKTEGKCRGTQILISQSALGPFVPYSDGPVTPENWECLDGTLYTDREGAPWMVFCHEWVQVHDGEMCAMRLSKDLKKAESDPFLLFTASSAPWVCHVGREVSNEKLRNYVTDGPFLYTTQGGDLLMIWSSHTRNGYALGIARSLNGITGPWVHESKPLYSGDGGHGMIFRTIDGRLMLTVHTPNETPKERPVFIELSESGNMIVLK